MSLVINASS
jgi:hypothetical protein